jgi:hypothetical protein
MRAWRGVVACLGIALCGVSACGGGHSSPPDGPVLGTRVDSPLPMDMDGTPDAGPDDAAADSGPSGGPADGGRSPSGPADGGPLTPDPADGQARPTSMVTSPS